MKDATEIVTIDEMDRLVFNAKKRRASTPKHSIIRVSDEAYYIIAEIEARTGYTMGFIASEMIKYANAHTTVMVAEN